MRAVAGALLFTFLVASMPSPATASEADPLWRIEDPAGDQGVEGGPPLTANPATSHGDLRAVTIDSEDEEALVVTFHVQSMRAEPRPDSGSDFQVSCGGGSSGSGGGAGPTENRVQFTLDFALADSPIRFQLYARVLGLYPSAATDNTFVAHSTLGFLCIYTEGGARTRLYQTLEGSVEANKVHLRVPKAAFLGQMEKPRFPSSSEKPVVPAVLKAGDQFTDFVATSVTGSIDGAFCCLGPDGPQDRAPNSGAGAAYVLKTHAANSAVRLAFAGPTDVLAASGQNQSAPFVATNTLGAKRLLLLRYHLEGADGAPIQVSGPASITLPPQGSLNFSAYVFAPKLPEGKTPRLVVRAESAGHPDEVGLASVELRPGLILGPDQNVLLVHAQKLSDPVGIEAPGVPREVCHFAPTGGCFRPILSLDESDPAAASPNELPVEFFPNPQGTLGYIPYGVNLQPLAAPIALAPDQPATLTLKLASQSPIDGLQLEVALAYGPSDGYYGSAEDIELGTGTASASVAPGGSLVSVPIPISAPADATLIPAGNHLNFYVFMTFPHGSAPLLRMIGKESTLTLPLVSVPDSLVGAAGGAFQLRAMGGVEEFVNPGESRLLNVTVLNQAPDNRSAKLAASVRPEGWSVELLPGKSFALASGDSIRLGVLVRAPSTAKEGERASVVLNATDGSITNSLSLSVLATNGVELADDSGLYKPDEDTQQKLEVAATKTPGAGIFAVAAALLGAALRRGRRD